jgi:hypoxanthine phosphoribosyltransferase/mannose-6-phosphate isomerase-like protein (cupin superfamily)
VEAVADGVARLADTVRADGFVPELIVCWRDPEYTYRGSETVATALAGNLHVDTKAVEVREEGERRELIDDFSWMRGLSKVLVVDDACYSGATLRGIVGRCLEVEPGADVRCAVLTALDPTRVSHLYYVQQHKTVDLLFPWGWSRSIKRFYDIYGFFGILDRRYVTGETGPWGNLILLAEDFIGAVGLLELAPGANCDQSPRRDQDIFLYVVLGRVKVTIGNSSGYFDRGEYLFVPREVGYSLHSAEGATVLQLASRNR